MAIDVTKLVDQFDANDFRAFVNEYNLGELQFKGYFPSQYSTSLSWEALQADFAAKVAADVVAFDSRAPRKARQLPGKVTGDIPKVEIARVKKESDLNIYRQLIANYRTINNAGARDQVGDRIVEWMYGDSRFVLDGVNARMEWLSKQIASTGKYSLTIANNEAGVVTKVAVDFGIPGANITNAAVDWDTTATATPIADIRARQATARAAGIALRFAFTDTATFNRMIATDEVQSFAASFANNALGLTQVPNLATVNAALAGAGLPIFIIWDSYVNVESKAGVYTATTGWEDGRVTLSATNQLGSLQWTTTADDFVNIDESAKANNDFVLVKAFAEQDPITVVTKGLAYATPVLNNASQLYIIKTQL